MGYLLTKNLGEQEQMDKTSAEANKSFADRLRAKAEKVSPTGGPEGACWQGQPLPRSQLRSVRCSCRYVYNAMQTGLIDGVITEASTFDD